MIHLQCQPKLWNKKRPWVSVDVHPNTLRGQTDATEFKREMQSENPGFRFRLVLVEEI